MQLKAVLAVFVGINRIKKALASGNMLTSPSGDTAIHAGQTMEITWSNPEGDTVDVTLMSGDPSNLKTVQTIALNADNNGQLPWKVGSDVAPGEYAVRIATKNGDMNYSPFFKIYDPVSPIKNASNKAYKQKAKKRKFL